MSCSKKDGQIRVPGLWFQHWIEACHVSRKSLQWKNLSFLLNASTSNSSLFPSQEETGPTHAVCSASFTQSLASPPVPVNYFPGERVCVLSRFSYVRLFATLWTLVCQAPLSMGFSRQEYWSGLPFPPPRDLPDPGIYYLPSLLRLGSNRPKSIMVYLIDPSLLWLLH